jgi:glycosyltransferase involved in cell wall biosynthesis
LLDGDFGARAAKGGTGGDGIVTLGRGTSFDGLICFGGADWWYHNRGHYDIQMCRQFSKHVPVLYVNSLGVRVPRVQEGSAFLRRVKRKLKSWSRGFVRVDERFAVVSPISVPGKLGAAVCKHILQMQVMRAAKRMGIRRPLVWVECPTAAPVVPTLNGVGLIYQRTDRYETFPDADEHMIRRFDRSLKAQADLTVFCSRYVFESEASECRNAQHIDHGVDFDRFQAAGARSNSEPSEMASLAKPRAGYIGSIDPHTFDAALLDDVARRLPGVSFALIGPCTLPAGECAQPNVHRLGQKPYESVADYMAACDVLIMPWNRSDWIKACNPVKLKEYLAVGRPVVSAPFEELKRFEGFVEVAPDAASFAGAIERCLRQPGDADARRLRVRGETWASKASAVMLELKRLGLNPIQSARENSKSEQTVETGNEACAL